MVQEIRPDSLRPTASRLAASTGATGGYDTGHARHGTGVKKSRFQDPGRASAEGMDLSGYGKKEQK
jgi:hypothetical protein